MPAAILENTPSHGDFLSGVAGAGLGLRRGLMDALLASPPAAVDFMEYLRRPARDVTQRLCACPRRSPWTWGGYVLFRDHEAFTLKLVHPNVIQVHVRFDDSGRTPWRIDVDEFFRATV